MEAVELHEIFLESQGVTTDSRAASEGRIFFALRGEKFDGHAFIGQALEKGCKQIIIDNEEYTIPGRTVLVPDVLTSLQQLARYHRQQFNLPVIGITGSNGKTTTKELVARVLSSRYRTLSTRGNLNNHIGVPLTLLELTESHEIAVIEMGANHVGEIANLCSIAEPGYGIITNIGSAHLEGFGSYEGVVKAKSELFRYIKKTGGMVFLNSLRDNLNILLEEIQFDHVSFGMGEGHFLTGELLPSEECLKINARSEKFENALYLDTQFSGAYNFENVLAAICIGAYFEVSPGGIKEAIEGYIPSDNRSQIIITGMNKLLLDAYNANPDSMTAAINNFIRLPGSDKSAILGDMLELGKYSGTEHKRIVDLVEESGFREVFLVGTEFHKIPVPDHFMKFENVEKLIEFLEDNPLRGRFVLLKGSRGIQLEKCLGVI